MVEPFENIKKRKVALSTFLIFLLALPALMTVALPASAAIEMDIPTNCYIAIAPNPVGVDQTMNIVFWLDHAQP